MRQLGVGAVLASCLASVALADDWPRWRGPQGDGVWRESGLVDELPPQLKQVWRVPVGQGYAGPAVADGKVFVTDRQLGNGEKNPDDPFSNLPVGGVERVLCLDEATGKELWQHSYPCRYTIGYPFGPRATPTVDGDRVYTVGAMGDLFCLDVANGKVLWSKNYLRDYGTEINTWGLSSAPLVDGDNLILIVGGSDNRGVMALNKHTGDEVWRALSSKDPGYCAPIIIEAGGTRQLIVWLPTGLFSLEPATGSVHWSRLWNIRYGMSIVNPIYNPQSRLLAVSAFYDGILVMRLSADEPTATEVYQRVGPSEKRSDSLQAVMTTPYFEGDLIYGVDSYGELRCLDAATGDRRWTSTEATSNDRWGNAFLVEDGNHPDRTWIANESGELILARLTPDKYEELGRVLLLEPTNRAGRRKVVWSHPAFANRRIYARNDSELICVDLAKSAYGN